eukprot:TRINITY_DN1983_c0_g1_i12.p3 TRINITY_DN1983_c0_g1~~TRINITY_DN1983_c0_g1_i12.p3  ORF type:complete len:206 (-),score=-21.04 TRINITY_DN1983_c0_g1_i12:871-1488(-)
MMVDFYIDWFSLYRRNHQVTYIKKIYIFRNDFFLVWLSQYILNEIIWLLILLIFHNKFGIHSFIKWIVNYFYILYPVYLYHIIIPYQVNFRIFLYSLSCILVLEQYLSGRKIQTLLKYYELQLICINVCKQCKITMTYQQIQLFYTYFLFMQYRALQTKLSKHKRQREVVNNIVSYLSNRENYRTLLRRRVSYYHPHTIKDILLL